MYFEGNLRAIARAASPTVQLSQYLLFRNKWAIEASKSPLFI
jgi:hypothetical protein